MILIAQLTDQTKIEDSLTDESSLTPPDFEMRQIVQNAKTGAVTVADIPAPVLRSGFVLVRTSASLISAGTERLTIETGQKSLIGRAIEQPHLVKQVLKKAKSEGVLNTLEAVRSKLGSLIALGYSAAGTITQVGSEAVEFHVGDRVACAGVGYASHAEVLSVPKNLCVRLPENVTFDSGAFGTLGAIALQGVRLAELSLGESVVVIGLGLIGQLTVQLLKAQGCRIFGIDLDQQRIDFAKDRARMMDARLTTTHSNAWANGRAAAAPTQF